MTATPSPKGVEPPPSAQDLEIETLKKMYAKVNAWFEEQPQRPIAIFMFDTMREEFYALTAERDEAQKRAEVAEAENVRLTEFMKRAHGNLAAALIAPSAKLETDLEVAPTA